MTNPKFTQLCVPRTLTSSKSMVQIIHHSNPKAYVKSFSLFITHLPPTYSSRPPTVPRFALRDSLILPPTPGGSSHRSPHPPVSATVNEVRTAAPRLGSTLHSQPAPPRRAVTPRRDRRRRPHPSRLHDRRRRRPDGTSVNAPDFALAIAASVQTSLASGIPAALRVRRRRPGASRITRLPPPSPSRSPTGSSPPSRRRSPSRLPPPTTG